MILKFKRKIIQTGTSRGVTIPIAYFKNEMLDPHGKYNFTVETDNNENKKGE